jgi:hypothetical protein
MRPLALRQTTVTPEVSFQPDQGLLVMMGECYPENPSLFFAPILGAVEAHFRASRLHAFEARFRLTYVNSASAKALRRLFGVMNAMAEHGVAVAVTWQHDALDDAAVELGDDLASGLMRIDYRAEALREAAVG